MRRKAQACTGTWILSAGLHVSRRAVAVWSACTVLIALAICPARGTEVRVEGSPEQRLAELGIPIPGDEYWQHGNEQLWADSQIRAFHRDGELLYAAGHFLTIGTTLANRIAAWNGYEWNPLGEGLDGTVREVTILGGELPGLYACGEFYSAGGEDAWHVARWDDFGWHGLAHFNATVTDVCEFEGSLVVAGAFDHVDGEVLWKIARLIGGQWEQIGETFNDNVLDVAVFNGALIAGGSFTRSGTTEVGRIAQWDGERWQPLAAGLDDHVNCLEVIGEKLYVGGSFEYSGSEYLGHISTWDGTKWEAIGGGVSSSWPVGTGVAAIIEYRGDLYVGGQFEYAGETWARNIAFWDGSAWNRLGAGTDQWVFALAEYNGGLYVGGWFHLAGSQPAENIALWQPSTTGVSAEVGSRLPLLVVHCAPNPFNPYTELRFITEAPLLMSVDIYDIAGRHVKGFETQEYSTGEHAIMWFGEDDAGESVTSGVYYFVLSSGRYHVSQKAVLVK